MGGREGQCNLLNAWVGKKTRVNPTQNQSSPLVKMTSNPRGQRERAEKCNRLYAVELNCSRKSHLTDALCAKTSEGWRRQRWR